MKITIDLKDQEEKIAFDLILPKDPPSLNDLTELLLFLSNNEPIFILGLNKLEKAYGEAILKQSLTTLTKSLSEMGEMPSSVDVLMAEVPLVNNISIQTIQT